MKQNKQLVKILLVDDDQEDIDLLMDLFANKKIRVDVDIAYNGVEAMGYLTETVQKHREKLPNLIFLDLNMPVKNGHEVLHELKTNEQLKKIPVIILT